MEAVTDRVKSRQFYFLTSKGYIRVAFFDVSHFAVQILLTALRFECDQLFVWFLQHAWKLDAGVGFKHFTLRGFATMSVTLFRLLLLDQAEC